MRQLVFFALSITTLSLVLFRWEAYKSAEEVKPAVKRVIALRNNNVGTQRTQDIPSTPLPVTQPNIVLIVADDLGWRDVGYNKSDIPTPNIDLLASKGVQLNRFYVQPTCSPTRASLLTGKSAAKLGITKPISKYNPRGLPVGETTLADHLQRAGYYTALLGKWHLGSSGIAFHPNSRGFDHFYGNLTGGIGYFDKVHGGGYDWQRNGETIREDGYTTHLIADEAIRLIESQPADQPIFLLTAFNAPHLPNEAPREAISEFEGIDDANRRIHAAMVSELDAAIGRIHQALVRTGRADNTIIWFMSDNGGMTGRVWSRYLPEFVLQHFIERRLGVESNPTYNAFVRSNLRDGGSDNRPFRGGKQSVQEGGLRVPAFIHWPNYINAAEYNFMTTVQDVLPSLLEAAQLQAEVEEVDGHSLWGSIVKNVEAPERVFFAVGAGLSSSTAAFRYPYKLVRTGDKYRLYNLELDPFEEEDISTTFPDQAAQLALYIEHFPIKKSIALPIQEYVDDPGTFGGVEDRIPWADRIGDQLEQY